MDIESEQWDEYETQFRALAEKAVFIPYHTPALKGAKHYLCLYGDNGLVPEAEFAELAIMETQKAILKRVEVDTPYWQDTVLFIE